MPVLSRSEGSSRFILWGIFVLSQAKILSELQKQSHGGVLQKRCSYKFCEISKNTFSYRTLSVATSGITHNLMITSIFFCQKFRNEFCKISKKRFSYRTPPVIASGYN